jgi:hypothetical protein
MVVFKCSGCVSYVTVGSHILKKDSYRDDLQFLIEYDGGHIINYKYQSSIYCYKCIQKCYYCSKYILKKNNKKYCYHCECIVKIKLIRNAPNTIKTILPNELIEMILQFI